MTRQPTDPSTCARCKRRDVRFATTWREGRICRRCYQRATRIHGICPGCGDERLLPGLLDHVPACVSCTGINENFFCTRCGQEDEPVRKGLCAHCCLHDDLTALLGGSTGIIPPSVRPIFDALTTQKHARSATIWLTVNPAAKQLLADLATGDAPMEHESFTAHPWPKKVALLRQLCVEHGLLSKINLDIERFEAWIAAKVAELASADRLLISQYATWVHLSRMRMLDEAETMRKGTFLSAKQSVTAAIGFVQHLRDRGRTGGECRQVDVDEWLLLGPTTRSLARGFVRWAIKHQHLDPVDFPYRVAKEVPMITQAQRIDHIRKLVLSQKDLATDVRVMGLLFLLYGQPLTRISRMLLNQLNDSKSGMHVMFAKDRLLIPAPFDDLVRTHIAGLPNMTTSLHRDNVWLFPGRTPGNHVHQATIMNKLRACGVDLRGARNSTLRTLVLEIPAPIVADSLGLSYVVADRHRMSAGAVHAEYVARRSWEES